MSKEDWKEYEKWFEKEGKSVGFTEEQCKFLYDMIMAVEEVVKRI